VGGTATRKVYSPPSPFPSLFLSYFVSANRGKWAHQWACEKKEKVSLLSEIEIEMPRLTWLFLSKFVVSYSQRKSIVQGASSYLIYLRIWF